MIKNYFKAAWRNLIRSKAFSAINILGMALGMACSLLIILWVQDERSVDKFHANGAQLYQVYEQLHHEGQTDGGYLTQGPLAAGLKKEIPEIQYAAGFEQYPPLVFQAGDKTIKQEGAYAGADFFRMFSYPLLQGDAQTALSKPGGIAISRKMANLFFGSVEQAMGKTIRYENKEDLLVTAVFEIPANSSRQFDYLRNWEDFTRDNAWAKTWTSTSPHTFIQLQPTADADKVGRRIKDFIYHYRDKDPAYFTELGLQPYGDQYLHATFKEGIPAGGRIEYVRLFSILAVFVLLIACINFMNLSTARSTERAREVGVRKVVGAGRGMLIGQFIGEALLLTSFAMLIAFLLVALSLPAFNQLTGKQLLLPVGQPAFWGVLIGLLLLTGFIAGSYPALFLSSLHPIRVLKGTLRFSKGGVYFRKGLVVFQFALSIILIVGMIVIYQQMQYVQNKNLGYNRENLVYIPLEGELISKYPLFKAEAANLPGIVSITKMKETPTVIGHHKNGMHWAGKDPNLTVSFADAAVGYDFVQTLHLRLKDGRDFTKTFGTDTAGYLLNEAAVAVTGYENPVGQPFSLDGKDGIIIGVLKDFHFTSMHEAIEPLVIRFDENQKWGTILVRTAAGRTATAIAGLEKLCKTLNPTFPFSYQFSDEAYNKLYKSEQIVSTLTNYFALLAIFISCLGLFGLATFSAAQRTKEIGVRKVLGATEANIVTLLAGNFLQPVLLGMLIAFPVAWWTMSHWLQDFAYKIHMEWWMLAMAGAVTIGIALLTVSLQSIKAAFLDPVKSLRSE
ncbi:FtsX-like permease family protein [Chitinophaga agrisoli]|uniref:FtsX-like permease family protein n=1 Tax=Chitinophaga agrisoli TaxID=2607653 RepID=A0A5B2W2L7_9BACT|nr:ABC transporter permease [Chitinophaga agrisoli]KAA2245324.1 FtsX-like permease family protein [Chitinophaga agrisoli]